MTNAASTPAAAGAGAAAEIAALSAAADRAAAAGRVREARDLLERAVSLGGSGVQLWINLGACRRADGDLDGALQAVDAALAIAPRDFTALLMRASLLERLGAPHRAGAAYGVALTQAPPPEQAPQSLHAPIERARQIHSRYEQDLAAALRASAADLSGSGAPTRRRVEAFIDRLTGRRRVYHQAPVQFHYPDLPEIEFYDREEFPSLEILEAATLDIIAELRQVMQDDADGMAPYVNYPPGVPLDQWAELNASPRWSAYHLLKGGAAVEPHCERCPRTMEAVAALPQPCVAGRSPVAMFSVLTPRTRIPPHTGVSNARLVLHLPLIVPPGCGFRVGSETREWGVGEAWVFDDTIEHEAWNDSDETRVILICDVWNPRLSEEERILIAGLTAAMDAFAGEAVDPGV